MTTTPLHLRLNSIIEERYGGTFPSHAYNSLERCKFKSMCILCVENKTSNGEYEQKSQCLKLSSCILSASCIEASDGGGVDASGEGHQAVAIRLVGQERFDQDTV